MNEFEVNILMKIKTSFTFFFQYLVLTLLFVTSISLGLAQTPIKDDSNKKQNETTKKDNQTSLEGLTEAILIDGQPALRIILGKKNNLTEVKYLKRDGEDALVFDVYVNQRQGKLYVTKSRIVFDPLGEKKRYFNIEKNKIKEAKLNGLLPGDRIVKMYFDKDENSITVFWGEFTGVSKNALGLANNFLLLTIKDFESALTEFNQLTASVHQNKETAPLVTVNTNGTNVEYDRFKDITTVSTIPVNVFDDKKISNWGLIYFRIFGQYQVNGSVGQLPKTVKLAFSWSGIRPFFANESEKTLNLIIDGKRTNYGELQYGGLIRVGVGYKEQVWVEMSIADFESFINAKSIEMQLANLEFALQPAQIESLRRLLSDVKGQ